MILLPWTGNKLEWVSYKFTVKIDGKIYHRIFTQIFFLSKELNKSLLLHVLRKYGDTFLNSFKRCNFFSKLSSSTIGRRAPLVSHHFWQHHQQWYVFFIYVFIDFSITFVFARKPDLLTSFSWPFKSFRIVWCLLYLEWVCMCVRKRTDFSTYIDVFSKMAALYSIFSLIINWCISKGTLLLLTEKYNFF